VDLRSLEIPSAGLNIFVCSEQLMAEQAAAEKKDNPANFGVGCKKHCMCEIPYQTPCPAVVPLPFSMRGKHKYARN
jgi:small subunit ribosomal protein S25